MAIQEGNKLANLTDVKAIYDELNYDKVSKSQVYMKNEALAKTDVVDDLTSGGTTVPLSANMGKTINDKLTNCLVGETLNVSGTTDAGGRITINKTKRFSGIAAVISNVSHDLGTPYSATIEGITATTVTLRIRSIIDDTAIADTSVDFSVLLFGVES